MIFLAAISWLVKVYSLFVKLLKNHTLQDFLHFLTRWKEYKALQEM